MRPFVLEVGHVKKKRKAAKYKHAGRPVEWPKERVDKLAPALIKWFSQKKNIWLKDFAHRYGITWQAMCEHADKSPLFSDALKRAKEMQEAKLVHLGLRKTVNTSMAIFALKNVAGWRDRQEVDLFGSFKNFHFDTTKLTLQQIDRLAAGEDPETVLGKG